MKQSVIIGLVISVIANSLIFWGIMDVYESGNQLEILLKKIKKIDSVNPDVYFNNKLVSAQCIANASHHNSTDSIPLDNLLRNITKKNVHILELRMNVHVKQWVEYYNTHGTGKDSYRTYYYELEWRSYYESSFGFENHKYQRHKIVNHQDHVYLPEDSHVQCDGLKLSAKKVREELPYVSLDPQSEMDISQSWLRGGYSYGHIGYHQNYIYISNYYGSSDSGDVRIYFDYKSIPHQQSLSVVGKQQLPFIVDYKDEVIGDIHMVKTGEIHWKDLLTAATNSWFHYYMYLIGGILNCIALYMIFQA